MDQIAAGEMTKDEVVGDQPRDAAHDLRRDATTQASEDLAQGRSGTGWTRTGSSAPARSARRPAASRRTARRTCCGSSGAKKSGKRFVGCEGWNGDDPDSPDSCDQTFPLPQRGDLFKLEERCSICGQTPRLKVDALARPALEALPQRRLPVDGGDEAPPRRARGGQGRQGGGRGRGRGRRGQTARSSTRPRPPRRRRRSPARPRRRRSSAPAETAPRARTAQAPARSPAAARARRTARARSRSRARRASR